MSERHLVAKRVANGICSFDDKDEVVSLISRQSIDTLSELFSFVRLRWSVLTTVSAEANFRDQVELSDWAMIKKMKVEQGVP